MELSPSSSADARKYYNKYCQVSQDINELSIGGEDYLNTYKSGNITGYTNNTNYTDYVFDLNCNYSRFTALAGVDDLVHTSFTPKMSKASGDSLKITIIADGSVLDTKTLYYEEKAEEIDVNNLAGYSKLILRVQRTLGKTGSVLTLHPAVYYDILGGKFYHK